MSSSSSLAASVVRSLLRLSSSSLLLHNPKDPIFLLKRFFSSTVSGSKQQQKHSFTISYLTKRCKFSEEEAISVAKVVSFSSPENPDKVMELLNLRGFTQSQLGRVIMRLPGLLHMNPQKTLSPKLDFFMSKGFSSAELLKILLSTPRILYRSLDAHIIPSFHFVAKALLFDDKRIRSTIRKYPSLLTIDLHKVIVPKINLLLDIGVSEKNIAYFLYCQPRHLGVPFDRFERIVQRAVDMGINPSKVIFVIAVQVLGQLSKSTWDRKLEAFSRWGWSQEMTLQTFTKYPWVMSVSVRKITAIMGYYKNDMGIESSYIAGNPVMLSLSLQKRIKPRCSVLRYLREKGLIGEDIRLSMALFVSEAKFLDIYIARFPEESEVLLSMYHEKMGGKSSNERVSLSSDN